MLTYDASSRPSAVELLQHRWIGAHAERPPFAPVKTKSTVKDEQQESTVHGKPTPLRETNKDNLVAPIQSQKVLNLAHLCTYLRHVWE